MRKYLLGLGVLALAAVALAPAWWVKGHASVTEAAAVGLPEEMPVFFRAGGKAMAHYAGDPDRWKNPQANFLRAAEACNHYLDLEDLENNELPADRWRAAELMRKLKQQPERVGLLPYAILENYDRLSCAFYDLRQEPNNEAIRAKCLVHAGVLSHFTGDLAMPLHTTRDYDGRKGDGGKVVQKGIHARLDGFPEKNGFSPEEICRGLKARSVDDVWAHVLAAIRESHTHVKRCYDLDEAGTFERPTAESRAFVMERCRVAAQLTMDLWYSAWLRSAKLPAHY
jgi:hypothetical protein